MGLLYHCAMATAFSLAMYPWVYKAKSRTDGTWFEEYVEKPHRTPAEEAALSNEDRDELLDLS